jgi:inorganic pyrophosphatase
MISKVETKFWQTTHKLGIELPKNVKNTYEIDKKTGTNFWQSTHKFGIELPKNLKDAY